MVFLKTRVELLRWSWCYSNSSSSSSSRSNSNSSNSSSSSNSSNNNSSGGGSGGGGGGGGGSRGGGGDGGGNDGRRPLSQSELTSVVFVHVLGLYPRRRRRRRKRALNRAELRVWFKEKGVPRAGSCRRDCATLGTAWPRNPTAAPNTRLLSRRTRSASLCLHPSLVVSLSPRSTFLYEPIPRSSFLVVSPFLSDTLRPRSLATSTYLPSFFLLACLSFFSPCLSLSLSLLSFSAPSSSSLSFSISLSLSLFFSR